MNTRNITFFIALLLIVGFGAYIFGTQSKQIPITINTRTVSPTPTVHLTPTLQPNISGPSSSPSGMIMNTPAIAVEDFYNWYIGCTKGKSCQLGEYPYIDKTFAQKIDTSRFSYNPVICAQNPPATIAIDPETTIVDDKSTVSVTENFGAGTTVKILVGVKATDGKWYITDITCPK